MRVRGPSPRTKRSARLAIIGYSTLTIVASVAISACTGGSSSATLPSFSPGASLSPTPTALPSSTATASASASASASAPASPQSTESVTPSPSPSPSPSPFPVAAPATGGGGTAGFQDALLLGLGVAAVLVGAGTLAYRRRVLRNR
jgi:hypothetical protein